MTSLYLEEETEASGRSKRVACMASWGNFSRFQCPCHVPALRAAPPSLCALTNSQGTRLGTKSRPRLWAARRRSHSQAWWPQGHQSHTYCCQGRRSPEHRA